MPNSFENEMEAREVETLASLAEDIVFRLPGCTDLMVRKTIQSVYRDFCKKTSVLVTHRKIDIVKGVAHYGVAPLLRGCVVGCIRSARIRHRDIVPNLMPDGTVVVDRRFLPVDDEKIPMFLEVVEIPGIGCEEAPKWFIDKYGDTIVAGVLGQLMSMTGRAWSDPQAAADERMKFNSALTEARVLSSSGGQMSAGKLNFIKKGCLL